MTKESVELLRMLAVQKMTGLSRPHIYLLMRRGEFPQKLKLGRATAFVKHEVQSWVEDRIAERDNSCR